MSRLTIGRGWRSSRGRRSIGRSRALGSEGACADPAGWSARPSSALGVQAPHTAVPSSPVPACACASSASTAKSARLLVRCALHTVQVVIESVPPQRLRSCAPKPACLPVHAQSAREALTRISCRRPLRFELSHCACPERVLGGAYRGRLALLPFKAVSAQGEVSLDSDSSRGPGGRRRLPCEPPPSWPRSAELLPGQHRRRLLVPVLLLHHRDVDLRHDGRGHDGRGDFLQEAQGRRGATARSGAPWPAPWRWRAASKR